MSLSKQILLSLAAGLAVGLFFGEKVAFLEWPARGFVQLLQVTVLPYVVISLITGVARGTPAQARRLASKGGLALALLLALSLDLVFVSPLALPPDKGGSFYATTDLSGEPQIDWLASPRRHQRSPAACFRGAIGAKYEVSAKRRVRSPGDPNPRAPI